MTPQPGQTWADNDRRCKGRTLRVDEASGDYVRCSVLTVAGGRSAETNGKYPKTTIVLARFTPSSPGYSLVEPPVPAPADDAVAAGITQPDGVANQTTHEMPDRVWDTGDQEPTDCDRVVDVEHDVWVRTEPQSWHLIGDPADGVVSWEEVLKFGPLTEARHG